MDLYKEKAKKLMFYILVAYAVLAVLGMLSRMFVVSGNTAVPFTNMLMGWLLNLVLTGLFLAILRLVYRGNNVARFATIAIGVVAGNYGILNIFVLMNMDTFNVLSLIYNLASFSVFFIGSLLLLVNNNIRKYFRESKKWALEGKKDK